MALEHARLQARDGMTLARILAPDFVHPVPSGAFLTRAFYHSTVERGAGRRAHTAGLPACVASSMAFPFAWDPGKAASKA